MSRRRSRGKGGRSASSGKSGNTAKAKAQTPSPSAVEAFWGHADDEATPPEPIRPTPEPAALPRSLGGPPLSPGSAAAHLAVVYEEAVRTATALAAANGLLAEDPGEDSELAES
ncbi:MAG: hypothetical protein ACRD2C_22955 [Acidimicrobiales bacterium]